MAVLLTLPACLGHDHQVTVDPIEVKPIHLDVDVHLEWNDAPPARRHRGHAHHAPAHNRGGQPATGGDGTPATDGDATPATGGDRASTPHRSPAPATADRPR